MGARFNTRTYRTDDFNKALKEFESDQEMCRIENGNSYSGGIGMLSGVNVSSREFNTYDEAEEYVCEHQQKWEPAIAVKFNTGKATESGNKKKEKLRIAIEKAQDALEGLESKFADNLSNQKSKTKGCKKCGSQVNKEYIGRKCICPVCHASMYSETQEARIDSLSERVGIARKNYENYKPPAKKGSKAWLIGGWCSE